ncbi:hypothetical protein PGT21_014883 [Puccinia graminis f. sp. tritici]|uniref:Uncharacterized protein n=1 Tax=Puccinia graminis f. sp. tritici TaxID=56615 RepID=A0A5B0LKL6_PUCGR|nr:hypothetical protein PGT21_014883 [Puccinia graminis f. sp. tritici]KAA1068251.1 hypothetical protein PGTUg99_029974 [Puccinia graminis f. sp. tritici]
MASLPYTCKMVLISLYLFGFLMWVDCRPMSPQKIAGQHTASMHVIRSPSGGAPIASSDRTVQHIPSGQLTPGTHYDVPICEADHGFHCW